MNVPDLSGVTPAKRAELIYAEARNALTARLWRAALGETERADRAANGFPMGTGGISDGLLMGLLAGSGGQIPGQAQAASPHTGDPPAAAVEGPRSTLPAGPAPSEPGVSGTMGGCTPTALGRLLRIPHEAVADAAAPAPAAGTAPAVDIAGRGAEIVESGATASTGNGALSLGANAALAPSFAAAGTRTGVPPAVLAAIVNAESAKLADGRWNPHSRNPRSSAAGLGQFLSGTWIGMAQTPGTWLNDAARAKGWLDARGRVAPAMQAQLLAMRYDPVASIESVGDLAKINLGQLEREGFHVREDPETLAKAAYLSHHLGLADTRRFLGTGLDPDRARTLLTAQIGPRAAGELIDRAGDPVRAHKTWLLVYINRQIRPEQLASAASADSQPS